MIENLAVWCGIIAIIASVIAVVMIFLVRNNIVSILEKDVVLFDKNFEIKKQTITNALTMVDDILDYGQEITRKPEFIRKAKACYNDLLCVMTDVTIADEFYAIALDKNIKNTEVKLANFKLLCRHDIGFKTKKAKTVKRALIKENKLNKNEIKQEPKSNNTQSQQVTQTVKPSIVVNKPQPALAQTTKQTPTPNKVIKK